jgi:hypothetical protein
VKKEEEEGGFSWRKLFDAAATAVAVVIIVAVRRFNMI